MKIYTFLLISAAALSSCAQNASVETSELSQNTEPTETALQQTKTVQNLSQTDFKKSFEGKEGVQVVDVRTPGEIAGGKIANAKELDYFDPEFAAKIANLKLDKSKPVVVYCAVGGRSSKAAQAFLSQGFTNVYNLIGGYNAYKM